MVNLKSWIRRNPPAVQLRVQTSEGPKVLQVETAGARRYANAERAVMDLGLNGRLEALDEKGNVLRVTMVEGFEEVEAEELDVAAKQGDGAAVLLKVLPQIAKMLNEAHESGAARHAAAYEMAFTKQNELLTIVATRLVGMEKAWQSALNKLGEAAASGGGGDEMDPMQLLAQVAFAKMSGGASPFPPKAAAPPAGKGPPPPPKGAPATNANGTNTTTNGSAK